jgi:hypothetical protein
VGNAAAAWREESESQPRWRFCPGARSFTGEHADTGRAASDASNLVAGDTNGKRDVFVRDRSTGTTRRVSLRDDEGPLLDGHSDNPAISADGQRVAFETAAGNVFDTPGLDSNGFAVALRIRNTGSTLPISVRDDGAAFIGEAGRRPAISGDGNVVAFTSLNDLVDDDDNFAYDVNVHVVATGRGQRVSVDTGGAEGVGFFGPLPSSLNEDGRFVAFATGSVLTTDDDNSR